jgi:hypothetical protein
MQLWFIKILSIKVHDVLEQICSDYLVKPIYIMKYMDDMLKV